MIRRLILAGVLAAALVVLLEYLNHLHTGATFGLLLPGIIVGCMLPDAACSAEGDLHPPGMVALILVRLVNIVFYGGLIYLVLGAWRALRTSK